MEQKKSKKHLIPVIVLAALLLLAGLAVFFFSRYLLLEGELYPRGAETLDLRGKAMSTEKYDAMSASLPGCTIRWDVPLGGERVDSGTESLSLSALPEDWSNLRYLSALRELTINGALSAAEAEAFRETFPECALHYFVPFGGDRIPADAQSLTMNADETTFDDLCAVLPQLTELRELTMEGSGYTTAELARLRSEYPALRLSYSFRLGERVLSSDTQSLTFEAGEEVDVDALSAAVAVLPKLQSVDFTGCALSGAEREAFRVSHPELAVDWTVSLLGETYPRDTTELILNEQTITDTAELEEAMDALPQLTRLEVCDCDLDNDYLAGLQERFPAVKVVWKVYFSKYYLKTDATYFIPSMWEGRIRLHDGDLNILRYCPDIVALDCGHMEFSDLSFLQYLPHLKYLILAECPIYDIEPLTYCKELTYLEIFNTPFSDLSPLLECPSLRDLNISYIMAPRDNAWEVLPQLTWLERLWYCGPTLSNDQISELPELLPNTRTFLLRGGEPTGSTWRYDQAYYDMRDAFEAYYMPGGTNDIDEDGWQIIVDDYGEEFHLVGWDIKEQRWWECPEFSGWNVHIIDITC